MRAAASKHAITIALFGAVLSAANWSVAAQAAPPKGPCAVSKQIDVPAKMRDGVTLLADVYRPTEAGSYPVLLMRLPYNKTTAQTYVYASPEYYASQCYIVAIQDVRGQYASQGVFYAFKNEMEDGYDSVEWAAALPGSNGKVGMYGFSYVGATQWLAAVMRPPHLAAIAPAMTSSDYYDGWSYEGGAWSLAFEESWPIQTIALVSARRTGEQSAVAKINEATGMIAKTYDYLPLHDYPWLSPGLPAVAGYFYDWIAHDTWDDYWRQWSIRKDYGRVQVPALNFDGWYDVFLNGAVENYVGMRKDGGSDAARSAGRLVIGPYMHLPWNRKSADVDFGSEADNPIEDLQVAWFDHYLKGKDNGADKAPPVRVFVMGADRWRDADNWPIPGTQFTSYYLHSLGEANSSGGNGRISTDKPAADEPPDRYVYDPANPVPSRGGHSCCTPDVAPVGPANQADIEGRARRSRLLDADSRPRRRGDRPGQSHALRGLKRRGHRLDGEARRCLSGRPRDQSQQRHCARAVSRVARAADEHHARPDLQIRDQCLADQQRLLAGAPDPPRGLQQQLPTLRPQPEHRPSVRRRRRHVARIPDHLPRRRAPIGAHIADHAGTNEAACGELGASFKLTPERMARRTAASMPDLCRRQEPR